MAGWLGLAATPTFLGMAWIVAGDATMPCPLGSGLLPLDGMAWMYLLMGLFHLPPWLKLASFRGASAGPPHCPYEGD